MSLPYYGGMRHINVVPGSYDQACGEIRRLRDDEIDRVMEFISRLKSERSPEKDNRGNPEVLSRHVGKFSFNEGERERLLDMVLALREGTTK